MSTRLQEILDEIETELRRNEGYLKATQHYWSLYQNTTYDRVFQLLHEAKAEEARTAGTWTLQGGTAG